MMQILVMMIHLDIKKRSYKKKKSKEALGIALDDLNLFFFLQSYKIGGKIKSTSSGKTVEMIPELKTLKGQKKLIKF